MQLLLKKMLGVYHCIARCCC